MENNDGGDSMENNGYLCLKCKTPCDSQELTECFYDDAYGQRKLIKNNYLVSDCCAYDMELVEECRTYFGRLH